MLGLLCLLAALVDLGPGMSVEDCPESLPRDASLQVHGDSCFEFILYRLFMYDEAESDCERRGGTLPLIKSQDIQDYLVSQIRNTYLYLDGLEMWIGLRARRFETDFFMWEDGTSLGSYSNWAEGQEPTGTWGGHDQRDCVSMKPSDHGAWYSRVCTDNHGEYNGTRLPYICQYRMTNTTLSPASLRTPDSTTVYSSSHSTIPDAKTITIPDDTTSPTPPSPPTPPDRARPATSIYLTTKTTVPISSASITSSSTTTTTTTATTIDTGTPPYTTPTTDATTSPRPRRFPYLRSCNDF